MAYAVELVSSAELDLERIYDYVQATGSFAAQRWFDELSAAIRSLKENPERCPELAVRPGVRQLVYGRGRGRYRIVYEVDAAHACVRVLHLRHGARRWPEHEA